MMIRNFALAMALLWPTVAAANRIEEFLGWSADGTAYGYVDLNDGDGNEDVLLCRTEESVAPPSWPAGIPPANPCSGLTCDDSGHCKGVKKRKALLAKYLVPQKPVKSGPQGQVVKLRKLGNKLRVDVGNKWLDLELDQYQASEESTLGNVFWRADGGAVAVELVTAGSGVTLYVRSISSLSVSDAKSSARESARVANIRGMQLHKAKDWNGSAAQFRTAISADPDWVTPRYNLACALGQMKDVEGAKQQLLWLSKSPLADARRRLEKGKTDEDLSAVRTDPQIRALLGLSAEPATNPAATTAAPAATAPQETASAAASKGQGGGTTAFTKAMNLPVLAWTDQAVEEEEGEGNDCQMTRSFKLNAQKLTVTGSYEEAISILNPKGKTIAHYQGESCLLGIGLAQLVPDEDPEIVVHRRVQVGRGAYEVELVVLKRAGDKLVEVFVAALPDGIDATWQRTPNLKFESDGSILHRDPYKPKAKEQRFFWDETKRKFLTKATSPR